MPKYVKVVSASCVHTPFHDKKAWKWFIQTLRDERPDEVVLHGDVIEADAASRWPSEAQHDIIDEYEAFDQLSLEVEDAAPNAKLTLLDGNHEANIKAENRLPKKVRRACQMARHSTQLRKWNQPSTYAYDRKTGIYRIGQVTFTHLFKTSDRGLLQQAILLGTPYGLVAGGHSHRPEDVVQLYYASKTPLPYYYCNVGCLCELDRDYMKRENKFEWGHACGVFNINPSAGPHKSPRMTPDWDAEVRIFQMFDNTLYHPKKLAI